MNNASTLSLLSPSFHGQGNLDRFSAFDRLNKSFGVLRAKPAWAAAALILTCLPYLLFV